MVRILLVLVGYDTSRNKLRIIIVALIIIRLYALGNTEYFVRTRTRSKLSKYHSRALIGRSHNVLPWYYAYDTHITYHMTFYLLVCNYMY